MIKKLMRSKGWRHPKKILQKIIRHPVYVFCELICLPVNLLLGVNYNYRSRLGAVKSRRVLFLNHKSKLCGVYQFGLRIGSVLEKSKHYDFIYAEAASWREFEAIYKQHAPAAVIWNHHALTMPWLDPIAMRMLPTPNIGIIHEVNQKLADGVTSDVFDHYLAPDPTLFLKNPLVSKSGRPIPVYQREFPAPAVPTIGSFGFGIRGKGFDRLIAQVQEEFDEAIIRLHISFAEHGDSDGERAKMIAESCRKLIWKDKIKLEITHHYLSDEMLLDFLAQNSLNAFLYETYEGRGISSVTDYALAVNRPIAVTSSAMFRHLHNCIPSLMLEFRSLKEILSTDLRVFEQYRREWSEDNLRWDYERMIDGILAHIGSSASLTKETWSRSTGNKVSAPAIYRTPVYHPAKLPDDWRLNRILDQQARRQYAPIITQLFSLAPDVMYRKIPEANIQQAFVLDTVHRLLGNPFDQKILCIGSYEDSAAWSLRRLGFPLEEIDPLINYDLATFLHKPSTAPASYDVIFSTSVIEHVPDDELFIRQIAQLLKPGGAAVLTCDFKEGFKPGDPLPPEDVRLYTKEDFTHRFLPQITDCHLVGEPDWSNQPNDFQHGSHAYSFATLMFQKNKA
jgi:SAM-dependent methyltransferase